MADWQPDVLGDGDEQQVLDIGAPSLVLLSARSRSAAIWSPEVDELVKR